MPARHLTNSSQPGARHFLSDFSGFKIFRPEKLEKDFAGNRQLNGKHSWRAADAFLPPTLRTLSCQYELVIG
jgi:hypothetical protein